MERKVLMFGSLVVATILPSVASAALIYEWTIDPAGAAAPPGVAVGSQVSVDVALAGPEASEGLFGAAVKLDFGPGLVLTGITSDPAWGASTVDLLNGSWEAISLVVVPPTDGRVPLATFIFTANATSGFTAVDPFVTDGGGVFTAPLFTQTVVAEATGSITVVPEPSGLVGLLGLAAMALKRQSARAAACPS